MSFNNLFISLRDKIFSHFAHVYEVLKLEKISLYSFWIKCLKPGSG